MIDHCARTLFPLRRPEGPSASSLLALRIGFCLMAIWTIFALIAVETRNHTLAEASRFGSDVATLLQNAIAREVASFNLSLGSLAVNSEDPAILALTPALRDKTFYDESARAADLGRPLVIDRAGRIVESSIDKQPVGMDISDRDYFRAHRDASDLGLFVSDPFRSRLTHEPSIALSRRRSGPGNGFDGVVVGIIQLSLFSRLFGTIHLPVDSTTSLIRADGAILSRLPTADFDQKRIRPDLLLAPFVGRESGTYQRASLIDGIDRLYSFYRIPGLPLIVNVGMSSSEILRNWRWEMLVIGTGFAILSAMIVLLGVNLGSEFHRRGEAEERLAGLASTDHLTSLANRRQFDEALEAEWRRGARTMAPLSLIMVDGDFFKSFNDTYGHVEGDRVLQAIAVALRCCVGRSGDLVARYGGEEFAVLLPQTRADGAMSVAAGIRKAIDALGLVHAKSPTGRLTVSIGFACRIADCTKPARSLVEAADAALYRAKDEGRDRIVAEADDPSPGLRVA